MSPTAPADDMTLQSPGAACSARYLPLGLRVWLFKEVCVIHPHKTDDSPRTVLQRCIVHCHRLTQIFKPRCLLATLLILQEKREGRKPQSVYLLTFRCLPLNTTAKAPCPTRSFLLYSKSPTVSMALGGRLLMDSLECCSPTQKIILQQNYSLSPGDAVSGTANVIL